MKEVETATTNNMVEGGEVQSYSSASYTNEAETDTTKNIEELMLANRPDPGCGPGEVFNPKTLRCEPE